MSDRVTPELLELVANVRASLNVAHGKMREIERALATMPQAQPALAFMCDDCGLPFKSERRLEEHLANVHARGLDEDRTGSADELLIAPMIEGEALTDETIEREALTDENPSYGPGNPDWERDAERERAAEELDRVLPPRSTAGDG